MGSSRKDLLKQYGMTVAQYDKRLTQQGGRCAICRALPGKRRLSVDHDHAFGQVRGLLCHRCNMILGLAGDRCSVLLAARDYLLDSLRKLDWTT